MSDLTEFLLARIGEDEGAARMADEWDLDCEFESSQRHYRRWDPARVLAECEAKRALIEYAFENAQSIDNEWGCCHKADQIRSGDVPDSCYGPGVAGMILGPLASVYADHPDYDEEWR